MEGITDVHGLLRFNIKHGQEHLIEKLPKGAVLTIVEHNEHYETSVNGRIGVGESVTEEPLAALESSSDSETNTTETYTFVIPDTGATVDFINDHTVEQSVVLKKLGFDNRDNRTWDLSGAVFKIYEDAEKTKPVELGGKKEFTSGEDGVFYSGKLGAGIYYLDEISVPAGYCAVPGMYILRVTEEGVSLGAETTIGRPDLSDWVEMKKKPEAEAEQVYTVSIRNTIGYELPSTGGPGTGLFYLLGAMLTILSAAGLRMKKRKA